jgi:hypothetical protein
MQKWKESQGEQGAMGLIERTATGSRVSPCLVVWLSKSAETQRHHLGVSNAPHTLLDWIRHARVGIQNSQFGDVGKAKPATQSLLQISHAFDGTDYLGRS